MGCGTSNLEKDRKERQLQWKLEEKRKEEQTCDLCKK